MRLCKALIIEISVSASLQVYMHPIYEAIEEVMRWYTPTLLHGRSSTTSLLALRFVYRGLCTAAITGVGYGLPHFSLISGLNGALTFWPLQVDGWGGFKCLGWSGQFGHLQGSLSQPLLGGAAVTR